jgi:peptidoglycan-N-acetylglucosamine deacetylase
VKHAYWVHTPNWFKSLYPRDLTWEIPASQDRAVYLTFDDGPHPDVTGFVLDILAKYGAHATFFCVGNNVRQYPEMYARILSAGHSTGNHTYDHLNGWKNDCGTYNRNIDRAAQLINSRLFRPPYGRIRYTQIRRLRRSGTPWRIIMWSLLSGDFDPHLTPEQCADNVIRNLRPGSIVVFHDSLKARERMAYALPLVLEYCRREGLTPVAIPM